MQTLLFVKETPRTRSKLFTAGGRASYEDFPNSIKSKLKYVMAFEIGE